MEGKRTRWNGRTVALLAACFLAAPAVSAQQPDPDAIASKTVRLVNQQRALNGAPPVQIDRRLSEAAQAHAEDMVRRDYVDHRSPDGRGLEDRAVSAGYPWRVIAENIAAGQASPESAVTSWMTSPAHRDNMLGRDFVHVGIGYVRPASGGRQPRYSHYWNIVFGAPSR